eukprot:15487404-Heterocapsa_arctica.AAC.1
MADWSVADIMGAWQTFTGRSNCIGRGIINLSFPTERKPEMISVTPNMNRSAAVMTEKLNLMECIQDIRDLITGLMIDPTLTIIWTLIRISRIAWDKKFTA